MFDNLVESGSHKDDHVAKGLIPFGHHGYLRRARHGFLCWRYLLVSMLTWRIRISS